MSEDISIQPSDGTNASEDVPAKTSESTSANEDVLVESSENASEDIPAKSPEETSTSEVVPVKSPAKPAKAGNRWLDIIKRFLVGVVMVLAVLGLIVDGSALVGVWAAYGPARSGVTD